MKIITVYFNNGHAPANYTTNIFALLVSDPAVAEIIDAETGEILFSRG